MPDYSLKGEEDRCEEDCQENCLAEPLWTEELEYGERRDGVVDEEVLSCGLNKDKSRVVEQADSTDELSSLQGDEGGAFEGEARSHTATGLSKGLLQLGDNWIIHGQKFRLVKGTNPGHHRLGEKVVGLEARRKRLFHGNCFL